MSAEGKKKRGVSGQTNAKTIPFRYHGYPRGYTLSIALGRPQGFAGSRFLNAMKLGAFIGGNGYNPTHRAYEAADRFMDTCPTVAGSS